MDRTYIILLEIYNFLNKENIAFEINSEKELINELERKIKTILKILISRKK